MPEYRISLDEEIVNEIRKRNMTIKEAITKALKLYLSPITQTKNLPKLKKEIIGIPTTCRICGRQIQVGEIAYIGTYNNELIAICQDCYFKQNSKVLAELKLKEKEAKTISRELQKMIDDLTKEYQKLKTPHDLMLYLEHIERLLKDVWETIENRKLFTEQEYRDRLNDILVELEDALDQLKRKTYILSNAYKEKDQVKRKLYNYKQQYRRW